MNTHIRSLVLCIVCTAVPAFGSTWIATGGGSWHDAWNWDTGIVPGPADDVTIAGTFEQTITLAAAASANSLSLGGGSGSVTLMTGGHELDLASVSGIHSSGTLRINGGVLDAHAALDITSGGEIEWDSGTIRGGAQLNILPGGELTTTTTGAHYLSNKIITVGGTLRHLGNGPLRMSTSEIQVLAEGLHLFSGDTWIEQWSGVNSITLVGELRAQVPASAGVLIPLNSQSGLLRVQSGGLHMNASTSYSGNSVINVTPGGSLYYTTSTHSILDSLNIDATGLVSLDGATWTCNADTVAVNVRSGGLYWRSGSIVNGGLNLHGTMVMDGSSVRYMTNLGLFNHGTVIHQDTGNLRYQSSRVHNLNLWQLRGDVLNEQWSGSSAFFNTGVFQRHVGTGTCGFTPGLTFHQDGSLIAESGTLSLAATGDHDSGNWSVPFGGTVQFPTSNQTFRGTQTGSVAGQLLLNGATFLPESGSIWQISGNGLEWTSGSINGGSLALEGPWTYTGGTIVYLNGTQLINRDLLLLEGTAIRFQSGSQLINETMGMATVRGGITVEHWTGGGNALINQGLLVKTDGTSVSISNLTLQHQSGEVQVQAGELRISGGGSLQAATQISSGAEFELDGGTLMALSGSTINGPGLFRISSGTFTVDTPTILVRNSRQDNGTINGSGQYHVGEHFLWTGGTQSGAGSQWIPVGSTLHIQAASIVYQFRNILQEGNALWDSGTIRNGYYAVHDIATGAELEVNGGRTYEYWTSGIGVLALRGQLRRTGGGVYTQSTVPLDITGGQLILDHGDVSIRANCTWTHPVLMVGSGQTLSLDASTVSMYGLCSGTIDGSFNQAGSTLNAGGPDSPQFALSGNGFTWLSGTLVGATLINQGLFTIANTTAVSFDPDTLRNEGLLRSTSDHAIRFVNGAVLHNTPMGSVELRAATQWQHYSGTIGRFVNEGRIDRGLPGDAAGTVSTFISLPLYHMADTLHLNRGTIDCSGGGFIQSTVAIADTARFLSSNGVMNTATGATFGSGPLQLSGGTLNIEGEIPAQEFVQTNGTLGGAGAFQLVGTGEWSGGTWAGSGQCNISGVFSLEGTGARHLGRATDVTGILRANGGTTRHQYGSVLRVDPAGEFHVESEGTLEWYTGVQPELRLEGLLSMDTPAGTYSISNTLFNKPNGSLEVTDGQLLLQTSGTWSGGSANVGVDGLITFASGTITWADTLDGVIAGGFQFNGTNHNPSAGGCGFNLSDNGLEWSAGSFGGGELVNLGRMAVPGTPARSLLGTQLRNEGQLDIDGGTIRFHSAAQIHNAATGLLDVAGTATMMWYSGSQGSLLNEGLWRRTTDPAIYTIQNLPFVNRGTLSLESGQTVISTSTLTNEAGGRIQGDATLSSGAPIPSAGTWAAGLSPGLLTVNASSIMDSSSILEVEIEGSIAGTGYDQVAFSGTATLDGVLDIQLAGGYLPAVGQEFDVLTAPTVGGSLLDMSDFSINDTLYFEIDQRSTSLVLVTRRLSVPRLVVTQSGTSTLLSWDEIPDATAYRVYVSTEGAPEVLLTETGGNSLDISSRTPPAPERLIETFRVTSILPDVPAAGQPTASTRRNRVTLGAASR